MREVRFGSGAVEQRREFADHDNDALTNFARMVTVFDTDPAISAAWVQLHFQVGQPGTYVIHWTKTSDESRTKQGRVIPREEWDRPPPLMFKAPSDADMEAVRKAMSGKAGSVIVADDYDRAWANTGGIVDKRPTISFDGDQWDQTVRGGLGEDAIVTGPLDGNGRRIAQLAHYDATVRIRRDRDWQVKAFCEKLDGMRVRVQAGWIIETDRYNGEMAMMDRSPEFRMQPAGWLASGDLVDWVPVDPQDPIPPAWPEIAQPPTPAKARPFRAHRAYLKD